MKNPFVQPSDRLQRLKHVQNCPHCFGEVMTYWGEDLRKCGKCPECGKRSVTMRGGAIVTLRYAMLVYGSMAAAFAGVWLIIWFL